MLIVVCKVITYSYFLFFCKVINIFIFHIIIVIVQYYAAVMYNVLRFIFWEIFKTSNSFTAACLRPQTLQNIEKSAQDYSGTGEML